MSTAEYAKLFGFVQTEIVSLGRRSLSDLALVFSHFFRADDLDRPSPGSRKRIYTTRVTFWAFLRQALTGFSSCRDAVQKSVGMAMCYHAGNRKISQNTSAYCQARAKLDNGLLDHINEEIVTGLEHRVTESDLWKGRRVNIVDGSGIALADTPANQKCYPQSRRQKTGCGFPLMKVVGIFSLVTGAVCQWATGNIHQHDMSLFTRLWKFLRRHDIILGDRGFCSYVTMAFLQQTYSIDCVFRLHQRRPVNFRGAIKIEKDDYLVNWRRPIRASKWISEDDFLKLPETLTVRILRIRIKHKGFRTRKVYLATTLVDAAAYRHQDLAELYMKRWQVELFFRDIKITMGMDMLLCQTPAMVAKEMLMGMIAYNLVRALIFEAAVKLKRKITEISFKAVMDLAVYWSVLFLNGIYAGKDLVLLEDSFLKSIVACRVYSRPGRSEPRATKRRPKNYQRLTVPRYEMHPTPHRGKCVKGLINART